MAYLKKVYQEIGGFGEYKAFISGDDDLFLTRVREQKRHKVAYAYEKASQVLNAPPKSFRQFVNQRIRYASKGFNYPLKVTIVLTLYVFYNLSLFAGPFLGILYNPLFLHISAVALLIKMLTEYSFVRQAGRLLEDTRFTGLYFLTSFLHIPYVLFFGIAGQFKIFKWAEKKPEYGISKTREVAND
jgi:cellulose synthase/poly-beta-1,6-N-acetylglucosamine synthase-like glycosyltransferase